MRFYGIAEKDNINGVVVKQQVFRERILASSFLETIKPTVKRKHSVVFYSRPAKGFNFKDFSKDFTKALSTGEWDEHWTLEEDYIPTYPVLIDNGQMLDLLSEQLAGVLNMSLLADIDINVLIDHTLSQHETLRENYHPTIAVA